jgi:hypothetical protein
MAELIKPKSDTIAIAKDQNNQAREVNIHNFADDYADTVTGKSLNEIVGQVEGYLK